jgi:hypothetical protein
LYAQTPKRPQNGDTAEEQSFKQANGAAQGTELGCGRTSVVTHLKE